MPSFFPAFGMESVFVVEYSDQQAERFNGYDGYLSTCFSTYIWDFSDCYFNTRKHRLERSQPLAFSKAHFGMTDAYDPGNNNADGSHYTIYVPGMDRIGIVNPGQARKTQNRFTLFMTKRPIKLNSTSAPTTRMKSYMKLNLLCL